MRGPVLCLWRYLWLTMLLPGMLLAMYFYFENLSIGFRQIGESLSPVSFSLLVLLYGVMWVFVVLCIWRMRWLWSLAIAVRRFRTVNGSHVILHYSPQIADKWDLSVLLERCETELLDLMHTIPARCRRKMIVYLFADQQTVSNVFRRECSGFALSEAHAIVLVDGATMQASMRHEMTHLLAARWSSRAPLLLSEGLAMWLEDSKDQQSLDGQASRVLRLQPLTMSQLLGGHYFFAPAHAHSTYLLAGSFTGFLIRHFGWKPYRRLYRNCGYSLSFRRSFKSCIGISLEEADRMWRAELLTNDENPGGLGESGRT